MADPFASLASGGNPDAGGAETKGKVLYSYAPQAANQMSLTAGTQVSILTRGAPGGWSKGVSSTGRIIYSPAIRMK